MSGGIERPTYREGFSFGGLSFITGMVLGVFSVVIIARLYGVHSVGEYAIAYAPTGLVWFLSSAKERPALIRLISTQPPLSPQVTGMFYAVMLFSVTLTFVVSAIAAAITYLAFTGPIGQPDLFWPAMTMLAGYLVVINTCWNLDAILTGYRDGRRLFWVRLHQSIAYVVFAVAGSFVLDGGVWSLVVAIILSWLTSLVHRIVSIRRWMWLMATREELHGGFRELPEIIKFGLKITPGAIAQGLTGQVSVWALAVVSPVATVGAWNRVWILGKRLQDFNYRLGEMLFPTLVERLESGDRSGFERALVDSLRYVGVGLLLPAAVGGGAAIGFTNLLGPGFSVAAPAVVFVLLVPPITATLLLQTLALLALDRPLVTSGLAIFRLVLTAAATIPLVVWTGITGAAIGLVVGCVGQLLVQSRILHRALEQPIHKLVPYRYAIPVVLAFASGFTAARAVDVAMNGLLGVAVAVAAGTIAYIGAFVLSGGILSRDRGRIALVTTNVMGRFGVAPANLTS